MRKLLLVAALVVLPTFAFAEGEGDVAAAAPAQQHHLAVAPQVVLPMGDWGDVSGLGFGLTLNYEYALNPMMGITGRAGYITHLSKEMDLGFGQSIDVNTTEIPVLVGFKYAFIPNFYGQAEFGLWHIGFDTSKGEAPDAVNRYGLTLGAGYQMDNLSFGAQYIIPNMMGKETGEDSFAGLMLNAAYTFMGF